MVGAVIPRLYLDADIPDDLDAADLYFKSNGAGLLPDAISCTVTEELDGQFELKMQYPAGGRGWERLVMRGLIGVKPNREDDIQPFRIYRITKPLSGIFTVYARHISYDLSGIAVPPFLAYGAQAAVAKAMQIAVPANRFVIETDIVNETKLQFKEPRSLRSLLLNADGSLLSKCKGDFAFDRYRVLWRERRGEDRGVRIEYGQNLLDLKQEESCASVYTGIFPYCTYSELDEDEENTIERVLMLPEQILSASGDYDYTHILVVDLTAQVSDKMQAENDPDEMEMVPTVAQLRSCARDYMADNQIGIPTVNLTVSFLNLEDTEEYKNKTVMSKVALGDGVTVRFPRYNVDAYARVTRTVYNCLTNKYDSVHIGDIENKVTAVIAGHGAKIKALEGQIGR